jgi:hypothetical protein
LESKIKEKIGKTELREKDQKELLEQVDKVAKTSCPRVKSLEKDILAHMLMDSGNKDLEHSGRVYNDSIKPMRPFELQPSQTGVNPFFSDDKTNTGFPHANARVEDVAKDPSKYILHYFLQIPQVEAA